MRELTTSWIELDAAALRSNIEELVGVLGGAHQVRGSHRVGGTRQLGFVVKSNAYGHGLCEIARTAAETGAIHTFFVATLAEALALRESGIKETICALVPADEQLLEAAIAQDIEMVCPDSRFLGHALRAADTCHRRVHLHLKIDSGLSRLGTTGATQARELAQAITSSAHAELGGLMTHFADATRADLSSAEAQYQRFCDICDQLESEGFRWKQRHAGASGSLDMTGRDSLTRVGTLLYGYWKSTAQRERYRAQGWSPEIRPVLSWKSSIFHLKRVAAGCTIGYGNDTIAERSMLLGVVPVGYGDGYPRALSGKGHVSVHGILAPVVGRVSMNLLTIDISNIPDVTTDDTVLLLGPQAGITADDLAAQAGTVTLDVLAGISPLIKRVVL